MKGETLSNAYRGTVFKAASTLGKLSGVARKAQKEMLEKELDISFGGNFQKITKGMEIHYDGDLPARSGIGSSSSFTVGLLKALSSYNNETINNSEIIFG